MASEVLPAARLRALAPEAFTAFDVVLASVPGDASPRRMELARRHVAVLLRDHGDSLPALAELPASEGAEIAPGPDSQVPGPDRAVLELTDQFVLDVAAVTDEQRDRWFAELSTDAFPVVQCVYVLDHGLRMRAALRQVFGVEGGAAAPGEATPTELWPALEEWMRAVARLQALDPLTTELVRLRGARAHNCRLCRSLRNVRAVRDGAGESTFDKIDDYERSDLVERHKVALRVVDAMLWQPTAWPVGLVEDVRSAFTDEAALELVLDVGRNAANKIAVAFGADQANVADGVELYDVDDLGDLVYGVAATPGP